MEEKIIIIGAGPAGLTAAYELQQRGGPQPLILEAENFIGGLCRTFDYCGNRMDMGGHRFFSKSDAIMDWWARILPLQGKPSYDDILLQRDLALSPAPDAPDPEQNDRVMLLRNRLSRIYFLHTFFHYPLSLGLDTFLGLGPARIAKIGCSYVKTRIKPRKKEVTLEDFMINRFGRELYLTFFKDYTEKVWGVPCHEIPADWGAQRIKGISITAVDRKSVV